jgi:ubiquinone/menaquinone biosynthesis C-methylase UbiE
MARSDAVNDQYNVADADSLAAKIIVRMRRRMYERFLRETGVRPEDTILDVGATSDRSYDYSNYLEAWYAHKRQLTAIGIDDASFLEEEYPGLRFVKADGRQLPFADRSFDFVHSSAVLEHVGARSKQEQMLRELRRVARKGVFVTTPNRWFPVEFHTVLPLLHWLPPRLFRAILRKIGRAFFADEDNLNLLTRRDLVVLARQGGFQEFRMASVSLLGWPSNLLLIARQDGAAPPGQSARPVPRPRDILATAWIAAVMVAYLQQFSAYLRPILALLR